MYFCFKYLSNYFTETAGASIFYTTNGLNPAPFQKHGPEAKATLKYSQPFRLAGGRRTLKAVAVAQYVDICVYCIKL